MSPRVDAVIGDGLNDMVTRGEPRLQGFTSDVSGPKNVPVNAYLGWHVYCYNERAPDGLIGTG